MDSILSDQFVTAAFCSWIIEKLKQTKYFPFINAETEKINKMFAALVAALATAGILVSADWNSTAHAFTFTIQNLSVPSVATFLFHWMGQYIYMKFAYKSMKYLNQKPTVTP